MLIEAGGILDDLSNTLSAKLTRLLFEKEIARVSLFSRLDQKFVNQIVIDSKPFWDRTGPVNVVLAMYISPHMRVITVLISLHVVSRGCLISEFFPRTLYTPNQMGCQQADLTWQDSLRG